MTEQVKPIEYARPMPPSTSGRIGIWLMAVMSTLAPFSGFVAIWLIGVFVPVYGASRAFRLMLASMLAGCAVSIVCGIVGLRAASGSRDSLARWTSLIGLIFGALMFIAVASIGVPRMLFSPLGY